MFFRFLKFCSKAFKVYVSLIEITFDLANCKEITDSEIENLCQCLGNLIFFQRLQMNCSRCLYMIDNRSFNIGKFLRNLRNLQEVHLDFAKCYKISWEGVGNLAQDFETSSLLQKIIAFFGNFSQHNLYLIQVLIDPLLPRWAFSWKLE